jgi:hypothetical protein
MWRLFSRLALLGLGGSASGFPWLAGMTWADPGTLHLPSAGSACGADRLRQTGPGSSGDILARDVSGRNRLGIATPAASSASSVVILVAVHLN